MIKTFWIIGIFISLSTFGIKTGLGTASILHDKIIYFKKKIYFILIAISVYIFLFTGLYLLIKFFPILNYLDNFFKVLQYGMLIHILVAAGIFLWGVRLLLNKSHDNYSGALIMILPCPVCALVIFLTLSFAYNIFSMSLIFITFMLLCIFFGLILITVLITIPFRFYIKKARTSFLGLVMVLMAIYFFLTVIIAPVYKDINDVYSLASKSTLKNSLDIKIFLALLLIGFIFFGLGFIKQYKKKKYIKNKEWETR